MTKTPGEKPNIKKFKTFYFDKKNWRPPSYQTIMEYMGWTSKGSVHKTLKKLKLLKVDYQEGKGK